MTDRNKPENFWSKDFFLSVCAHLRRELAHSLAALNPAKRREKALWLARDGVEFLRSAGIGCGDTVVDFGCGGGAYSIPAALLVGKDGLVVSVDVQAPALKSLVRMASARGLDNIRAAQHLAEVALLLNGRPCQAVLLYDVLHFMDADTRKGLYRALHERLRPDGFLSVFPKHLRDDSPSRYFRDMTIKDVSEEIEETGFLLCGRLETDLWHNPGRERGTVLTFRKANETTRLAEASAGDATQPKDKRRGQQA